MQEVNCKFCSKEIKRDRLQDHAIAIHFSCFKCDITFNPKSETLSHFKETHPSISISQFEKKAQCKLCTYVGRDKSSLTSHSRIIHHHCFECDIKYEDKEDILQHPVALR